MSQDNKESELNQLGGRVGVWRRDSGGEGGGEWGGEEEKRGKGGPRKGWGGDKWDSEAQV